jgi:sigma-54 specific flagellar transcriptional regulator A
MAQVSRTCERIAAGNATVLLTGETGTGKEVIARMIHERSPRAGGKLVPVNCGAIPETLLESELFGYVRGAFTGATAPRRGRISYADGGTLFLDEIGEMPLQLQVKLLRVLQEHTYEPVGSTDPVSADFRLIAATNRDLAEEVEAGRFRRDLYYRLLVCPVELPALRERPEDIACLFEHFWAARGETREIEPAVFDALRSYEWPGNVRELQNLVERLSVLAEGPVIQLADLPAKFTGATSMAPARRLVAVSVPRATETVPEVPAPQSSPTLPINLPEVLRQLEDAYINAALRQANGSRKNAAQLLGLGRTTLVEKLRRRRGDGPEGEVTPSPASIPPANSDADLSAPSLPTLPSLQSLPSVPAKPAPSAAAPNPFISTLENLP